MSVLILGAGMAGCVAAHRLVERGYDPAQVRLVEKGRGVGGRMAVRRVSCDLGEARFDHGAQFFTSRSDEFLDLVNQAVAAGVVAEWTRGFAPEADSFPRWRGVPGMSSLAKWLLERSGVVAELGYRVDDLATELARRPADAVIVTAPVPQALAVLTFGGLLPEPALAGSLAELRYQPTISVLVVPNTAPVGLPPSGARQFHDDPEHPDLAFLADNHAKGISEISALTIHLSHGASNALWGRSDDDVVARALAAAAPLVGPAARLPVATQVHRWRFAEPINCWPESTVVWGSEPVLALAGEAFAGPKVEGAFRSGRAAADAVLRNLA